jgi:predicted RecA/RadA family phage recombinase
MSAIANMKIGKKVEGGAVVIINDMVAIAATDATADDAVTVYTAGVFTLPKQARDEFQPGEMVTYNTSSGYVANGQESGNPVIGFCISGGELDSEECVVLIQQGLKNDESGGGDPEPV